jgi:serine/threonine protein kinase
MGTHCTSCQSLNKEITKDNKISTMSFKLVYPIGKGGFGKVWKVIHKTSRGIYAMKEISKVKLYLKKSITLINEELLILKSIRNFFISNLHFAFQNEEYLFLVYDYFPGGDLRYHINNKHNKRFNIEEIKFILACVIIALIYLRQNNIIHRDIKPENLVFDSNGYLHLTDFGVAHEYQLDEDIIDTSGTPSYMAPEALLKKPHSFIVDFFSLGVLLYELMFGERPYMGRTKKEIREQVISKEITVKDEDLPKGWSDRSVIEFVNGLLKRKPHERLGKDGVKEVMMHQWLMNVDWNGIKELKVKSPIDICGDDNYSEKYVNNREVVSYGKDTQEYYVNVVNANKCFCRFYYNRYDNSNNNSINSNGGNKDRRKGKKMLNKSNSLPRYSYLINTKQNSFSKGNVIVYSNKYIVNNNNNNIENKDELSEAKSISNREVFQEESNKLKL